MVILHCMVQKLDVLILEVAAQNGALVVKANDFGRTPLYIAAQEGHLAVVEFLATKGGASSVTRLTLVALRFIAAMMGHLDVVQWLAANGGSVTQPANDGATPLYTAAEHGHLEV